MSKFLISTETDRIDSCGPIITKTSSNSISNIILTGAWPGLASWEIILPVQVRLKGRIAKHSIPVEQVSKICSVIIFLKLAVGLSAASEIQLSGAEIGELIKSGHILLLYYRHPAGKFND